MAQSTTHIGLPVGAVILDVSANGHTMSYSVASGGTDTLYVLDLNSGATTTVISTPATPKNGYFSEGTGISGGKLSSDGHFIFYSTGEKGSTQAGGIHLFVKDLHSGIPASDVTPDYPSGPLGSLLGFTLLSITDDGHHVLYRTNLTTFGDINNDFTGLGILDTTTGLEVRRTSYQSNASLTPDGKYLSYEGGVENLQTHAIKKYPLGSGLMSDDGRYVAYFSLGTGQIQVEDRQHPSLINPIASANATGDWADSEGNTISAPGLLGLSGDGRHVVFNSAANNLVPNDLGHTQDIFVKDMDSGAIRKIGPYSTFLGISYDGSRLFFADGDGVNVTTFLPPKLTINPVTGDNYINASEGGQVLVQGTSDAIGRTVLVTVPNTSISALAIVGAGGIWSAVVNTGSLGNGFAKFHASVVDEFGHIGTVDRSVIIDRAPPSALDIASVAGDNIINAAEAGHAAVVGSVLNLSPTVPNSTEAGKILISIDNGPSSTFLTHGSPGPIVIPEAFGFAINATGVVDGLHTIHVTAVDNAGNVTSTTRQVMIDTKPPIIAITSVSGDDVVSSGEAGTPQSVHGTSDAIGRTVTVLLDGVAVDQAVVQPDGTWLSIVDFSSAGTGDHAVTAQVSDVAGNPAQSNLDVLVDRGFAFTRLSVGPNGEQSDGAGGIASVRFPSLSADGTKLVFTGQNFNLLSTATGSNGLQVYVKDLVSGAISFVTPDHSANSQFGAISPDGDQVVFVSNAPTSTMDPAHTPSWIGPGYYTYVEDLATGIPHIRVFDSVNPDTYDLIIPPGSQLQLQPKVFPLAISSNGYDSVLVQSPNGIGTNHYTLATLIWIDDSTHPVLPGQSPMFIVAEPIPAPPPSGNYADYGNIQSYSPQISADGSIVAFEVRTHADHPVGAGVPGPDSQIYAGSLPPSGLDYIPLASSYADGTPMPFGAINPKLSADGKFVAFWGWGTDGSLQVFVKNLTTGALNVASSDAQGNQGDDSASDVFNGGANTIAISADGRYVAFTSDAVLTPDEVSFNATPDLFVKDMITGAIQRVPLPANALTNDLTTQLAMTADGQYIVFTTDAALDPNDTNGVTDIYGISLSALNSTPPALTINAVTGDDRLGQADISNHVIVSGTSDAIGETVTLTLDGSALADVIVANDGTWSTTINATLLADGSHHLRARVETDEGTTGADGDRFTIDRVAPTVVLSVDKTGIAAGETAIVTATFSEGISNITPAFFSAHGGTLGALTFVNDHTVTAVFTPLAGADFFSITANPGTAFDFSSNPTADNAVTMTVGLALDGYLSGSLVFIDANGNGVYDDGEAATTTDASGHFVLSGGSGPLVLLGGIDIATGLPFSGVLSAPEGFTTITPLTTLARYVQQESGGDTNALVQLVSELAHASGVGDLQDVIAAANLGDADAQSYLLSCVQLADAAALMSSALAGASGKPLAEVYADVMQGLAHAVVTNGASTDLLQQVPATMAELAQGYGLDPTVAQNVIDATNAIIQNIADAAADIPFGADGVAFLEQLYNIARVAQGAASDVVGSPDVQNYDPFGTVVAGFTGDALQNAITAATPAAVIPVSLTALDAAYTQDFDSLSNSSDGTSHALNTLGWLVNETGGDNQYAVDTGASSAGNTYSYGADGSTDRALGSLRSDTVSSTFGAAFVNNTGSSINALGISYVGEQWRLGTTGRSDGLRFEYSLDATNLTSGTWTHVQALDVSTPQSGGAAGATDGNASGFNTSIAATIAGLNVANGATVFVRWIDIDATGDDDGLAVDNFSLTAHTVDATAPSVDVEQAGLQDDPTDTAPIVFSVTFSEDVTGFDASDIDLSASTVGGTLVAVVSAGPTSNSYAVSVTGMTGTGEVVLKVGAGAASDAAGNQSLASTSIDNSVAFGIPVDETPPEVTINQASGQTDPSSPGLIAFTVTFSEPVTGFTSADIDLSASTAPGHLVVAVIGGPTQYTVAVTGMTGPGNVVAKVPAGATIDAAGNANLASTSTDNIITIAVDSILPALPDHYAVEEGVTKIVSAPGVLGNDGDVGALTASLVSGPAHGDLTFNPDGSFAYTPDAGFNGRDSFTYQASDGANESGVTTVTLRAFHIDSGSPDADVLDGTDRDDLILGKAGNDTLYGHGGDDKLDGGRGADEMHGGSGNDVYMVDDVNDRVIENPGEGTDRVVATVTFTLADEVENLTLKGEGDIDGTGNGGANRLIGNDGDNTLSGLAGDDVLNGGDGDDVLTGGAGRDVMIGGAGNDRFVFKTVLDSQVGAGHDIINDFTIGQDKIDLSAIDADSTTDGDQSFSLLSVSGFTRHAGQLQAKILGENTLVSGDVNGDGHADFQIVLKGQLTLQTSDFQL